MLTSRRIVLAALLATLPRILPAQQTILVSEDVRCECVLRAVRIATLSDPDGAAGLAGAIAIERLPDGRILVVPSQRSSELLLFDQSGRFDRRIGRSGAGPQEFRGITGLRLGPGDSLFVMDSSNGRFSILDPALRFVRVASLPVTGGWFGITDRNLSVILTGIPRPQGESLERIRVFDPAMNPVRAFMRSQPTGQGVAVEDLRRRMAVSASGEIAISHTNRYQIEIWDVMGRHLRTLQRSPLWFRPASSAEEPPTVVETVRMDGEGRLWTVTHVADSRWREAFGPPRDEASGPGQGLLPMGQGRQLIPGRETWYQDSIVEVLDPNGVLLGRVRVDPKIDLISNDGYGASYREDDIGLPYIDIWRFHLE